MNRDTGLRSRSSASKCPKPAASRQRAVNLSALSVRALLWRPATPTINSPNQALTSVMGRRCAPARPVLSSAQIDQLFLS